jgi:hypothetical protein
MPQLRGNEPILGLNKLISALEELRKGRNKNKSLKEELNMKEGSHNSNLEEVK